MKLKLRSLTATNKGKLLGLASAVASEYAIQHAADVIPPAYPCDNERLVVIFFTAGNSYQQAFEIFCKNLKKDNAQHVALVVDGTPEKAAPVIEWIRNAGCHFHENVLYINGGLPFKFMKKYSEDEKKQVFDWVDATIEAIKKA